MIIQEQVRCNSIVLNAMQIALIDLYCTDGIKPVLKLVTSNDNHGNRMTNTNIILDIAGTEELINKLNTMLVKLRKRILTDIIKGR